jgi:dTDP-4-dehydrorhamnose reductase
VYHLAAGGYTSRYEFAKAIIDVMKEVSGDPNGWASVKPTTSDKFPLPARRPRRPVTSMEKIKRVCRIEMPRWETQLKAFLAEFSASGRWRQ